MNNKFTKEAELRYINDQTLNDDNLKGAATRLAYVHTNPTKQDYMYDAVAGKDTATDVQGANRDKIVVDAFNSLTPQLEEVSKISEVNMAPINTIWFPYTFQHDIKNNNTLHRTAFLLVKTYLHQILKKYDMVSPEFLYQIFNTKQQIVELPYALVLYLGGLYRLNNNKQEKDLTDYDDMLDYVSVAYKNINKKIKQLNDSDRKRGYLYDNSLLNQDIKFNFQDGFHTEIQSTTINPSQTTTPFISHGIYGHFLNYYNKYMFGTYLNGSKTNITNSNTFSGYHTGILKPFKIYKISSDFTALYRVLSLGATFGRNLKIQDIKKDWDSERGNYSGTYSKHKKFSDDVYKKLFTSYSKLKVLYLTEQLSTKELKQFIAEQNQSGFFKHVIDVFFSPYSKSEEEGSIYINNLPKSLNHKKQTDVADFLIFLWDMEKANMLPQYQTVDSKLTFALYPSAGGFYDMRYVLDSNITQPTKNNPHPRIDKGSFRSYATFANHINTVRLLWFENPKYAYNILFTDKNENFIKVNYDRIFKYNKIKFKPTLDLRKKEDVSYYQISMLMDSLDFEKLESFGGLFDDFANNKQDGFDNFTLKSLLLASTVFGGEELIETGDIDENFLYQLVGNSAYNYDFICYSGIASSINITLTKYQEIKCDKVIGELLSNNITIANFTPMGSVEHNESNIQPHNFPVSLDFLFGQKNGEFNYTDFISQFGTHDNVDTIRYFVRKILFGDQYVKPYADVGIKGMYKRYESRVYRPDSQAPDGDKISTKNRELIRRIVDLNETYLINYGILNATTWYYADTYKLNDKTALDKEKIEKTFLLLVNNFFEFLNIEITEDNYKLLFRLIRGFIASSIKDTINLEAIPGNPKQK